MRILIVEDDPLLADALTQLLRSRHHAADTVTTAEMAEDAVDHENFDLMILDIGLPGMDGFELLRRLRAKNRHVPVLVLTARDAVEDRVAGLELGADDYLVKPFANEELLARLLALSRRSRNLTMGHKYSYGPLELNLEARSASLRGVVVDTPQREWDLLRLMVENEGRILGKERIVAELCAVEKELSANAIEVYVSRLRQKLEPAGIRIRTVRGFGYMLEPWLDDFAS
ncbi:MAG: response regulator transcription factor [Sulfuritalea sp.]|jgi:two-component system OmpR family response regulator|nr:response regulator transcription factor [Sulfuritalea sp.]